MKTRWKLGIAAVALAGAGVAAWALLLGSEDETYEFFTSAVTRGTIQNTIAATGNVEAMVTLEVGSQVTGQVQSIYADFNSVVTEGQILARLDPRNVETQLRNVRANLRSAESRIKTAEADRNNADVNLASARANKESAELDLQQAELNFSRAESLFADELIPMTELENATIQLQSAKARVIQQEASVQQAEAQIISRDAAVEQAYAALEQAGADLEEAELNVGYTVIQSPVDGVVISREVDVGQTVSASTSAPTLFIIANDLARMRVQASIDEADIGLLGQDNEVNFRVDAYPNDEFRGRIEEIRLNPTTSQNVVTYSVIVTFENPDLKLKPGMTANITITVDRRDDVLSVPNTALRYTPPDIDGGALLESRGQEPGVVREAAQAAPEAGTDEGFSPASGGRDRSGQGAAGGQGFPEGFAARGGAGPQTEEGRSTTVLASGTGSSSMPGQEWEDTLKIQFQAAPPAPPRPGRVWVMTPPGVPEARDLTVGLTDGSRTEVVSGDIREGELVLIGDSSNLATDDGSSSTTDQRDMFRMLGGGGGRGR